MIALQITQPGEIRTVEIEKPIVQDNEVLLRIRYVGFCGSDLNTYKGRNPLVKYPVIPGHEIAAIIESIGSKVPAHLSPGLSCTVNPYTACGKCTSCRQNRPNACRFNQTLGVQRDGAMCEYISVPWEKVICDGRINLLDLTLVEPMSVGFHAVARAKITNRDTVMVAGCGMIGIGAIVGATARGAGVIAVDIDNNKLILASKFGAQYTINSKDVDVHEQIEKITGGNGVDVSIEAVGEPTTYQLAINETAFSGRVVYIGYAKQPVDFETKFFVQKELDIHGSRNALPEDFHAVIDYIKNTSFSTDKLISAIYRPQKASDALNYWLKNPGNVFRIFIEF
jgi:threonine dehydrogenase-like Zn-dependent dehydrogenase